MKLYKGTLKIHKIFFQKHFVIILLLVANGSWLLAQSVDSLEKANFDSVQLEISKYKNLVEESAIKGKADSLKKAELLEKIELLKERDKFKEVELLSQIKEIEKKDSLRNVARSEKVLKMKETVKGYPVAPFSDTLFMVYIKIGPVHPQERAASTAEKIKILYQDDFFVPDSIKLIDHESTVDITYEDLIVMSITDWDALWYDVPKGQLALEFTEIIKKSIFKERKDNSMKNILIRIGLTVLILMVTLGIIFLLNRLFRKLELWISTRRSQFFKGIRLRDYEILPPKRQLDLVIKAIHFSKWAVFVIILYVSLPVIFSLFPFTEGWAHTLFQWVLDPTKKILHSIINYAPNVFSIAVIYIVTKYFIKLFRFMALEVESGRLALSGFHSDWAKPTFNIIKILLYAFMFVVIFPYLPGSDSPIFQGVSVFLGVLFSLGSSTAISNAVSGLVITYMRPFQIGDRIKIGEITGEVTEKSLLVTRIKTTKNEYITVPNSAILSGHTINYSMAKSMEEGLILHTSVTIGYDVPWREVHKLLISAASVTEGVIESKTPFVLQTSLDDNYVSYQLNAYTDTPEKMPLVYSNLHENIQDKFNEANIEILSPHYRAVRDGNMITIPVDYLPKDYKVPVFNVNTDKKE